ncbi:SprB repeat-containing protein [Tenacibaculum sp. nBUS_03]|uniref:SprB repeat-containing protein n=1 Tax=Tenacibaculum sp. nBUS_03 TaxID=3395320 RepID=UPI003EBBDDE7
MKKLLLFLFFIFISLFESYSQQYKIKVSGFYGSGSSGCGTINGLRGITLITSSGKRISIHNRGYHRNQPFSGSKDFSQNDPVVKVEFFSTTRHKTWIGDCRSGRDARKTVNVSLPCFGKRYTKNQIFEGRTNRGYAYIEIIPLPQIKFTNGSSIYSTQTVCETSPVKLTSEFTSYRSPSTVYKWEFFDRVNKITRNTAGYQSLLNQLESAKQQWEDCLNNGGGLEIPRAPNNKNKKDNSPERAARPINGNCNFYFERVFELSTQVQNYSPKTEQVPIWRSIPSKNGKPAINLYLSNLYSRAADRAKALNNLKIQVRLNPGCNGDNDKSRTLSVQFLPEPPEVAKAPTFNQPLCSYSDVKGFVLYFKRQLYSHEKIEINLLRKFQNGSYVPEDDNVNIRTLTKVSTNVYKYTWRSSRGKSIKGGDYRIEVSGFNKANNSPFCKQYKYDFKISVPTPITYNAVRIQDELCYNSRNGKIKITASGGTGSYLYSLNNGSTWSKPFGGTITLSNKSSGTYLIKVKDTNGCIDKTKANVKVIIAKKNKITHVVTTSQTKHTSAPGNSDGSIKIGSVNGGTPTSNFYNYTVLLKGSSSNTKTGKAYKSGFIIPNLPAGIHKIVYKDKNNCTQQYTLPEIKDPKPITFSISSVKPDCYQGQGKVNIASISGGYPKYTVIIKKNGSTIKTLSNIASSTSVNVLSGSYSVLIKDTRQGKLEKTVVVASQSQVKITAINVNPIKCHSGKSTVTISATGGKSNSYQYAIWKGSSTVWQNSNTFSLAANTSSGYRFRVRDRNITSCFSAISSVKKITQPALLEVSNISVVDNKIFNGSIGKITLTIVGGTGSYSVTWKKKNATFTKTGNSISGLKAGFYTATIKDTNGCTINSREIEVKELPELKAQLKVTKIITCNGGKGNIQAVASGGSGSYTYKWKRNGVLLSNSGSVIVNVIQGNYSVTVSDSHTNKTAVIKLTEPTKVTLSIAKTDITCFNANNGKIKLTTNGGSGSYFYSIDNKASYKSTSTLSNNTIEGLAKGNYTIWLKDSKGCVIAGAKTTTINEPSVIGIESTSINNCDVPGGKTGSIAINITGGSGTYTYKWTKTGTPTFIKNIKNINSLYAGIYKIEVTDSKGCIKSKTFEVKEPKPINVTIKQTKQILCFGENSASLLAEVKGGYPLNSVPSDFTYKWYLVNRTNKDFIKF